MSIHLIKLCVGIEDVDHLIRVHKARVAAAIENGEPKVIRHITRNMPRRSSDLQNGGSMYWVIRRKISVRQPIIGINRIERTDGRSACAILLADQYIRTEPRHSRSFQGWRYLSTRDAPIDIGNNIISPESEGLPLEMAAELQELGLL